MQEWTADGCNVGGLLSWNANAVGLEVPLSPKEALGGQLVIPETTQQLAQEDVRLAGSLPQLGVSVHDLYFRSPFLILLQFENVFDCKRVLFDCLNLYLLSSALRGLKRAKENGAAASTDQEDDGLLVVFELCA